MFVSEFGWMLSEDVKLYLPDGSEYSVYLCGSKALMIGLKKMLKKYGVKENYVVFFEYLGRSSFYITLYNAFGVDIFDSMHEKLLLLDVIKKLESEVIQLSDSSDDDIEG